MVKGVISFMLAVLLVSCTGSSTKAGLDAGSDKTSTGSIRIGSQEIIDTTRFSNISFASDIDTTCGMPLSAGITDTMLYHGKIYGFCSPGCKQEFAALVTDASGSGQEHHDHH